MAYDQLPVLGDNPQGSFSNVKDRLVDVDSNIADYSKNLVTEIDMWYLGSAFTTSSGSPETITNLSRFWANYKGSGMSHSSGVFTFPSTGFWLINYNTNALTQSTASYYVGGGIETSIDGGSTYSQPASLITAGRNNTDYVSTSATIYFPVLDTTTHLIKFYAQATNPARFNSGYTNMQFIKLGEL